MIELNFLIIIIYLSEKAVFQKMLLSTLISLNSRDLAFLFII